MDVVKKEILALTLEQQSHVHAIIGDSNCLKTANGVRFNLHKLTPDIIENIKEYIAALGKDTAPALKFDNPLEQVAPSRKKIGLTKHQVVVKKRLKALCKQRKTAKQDRSSKIDVSIASEFCDALKIEPENDEECEPSSTVDDVFENDDIFDNTTPQKDDICDDIDDGEEANEDTINDEDDGVMTLPSHLMQFPTTILYDYFISYLKDRGFSC